MRKNSGRNFRSKGSVNVNNIVKTQNENKKNIKSIERTKIRVNNYMDIIKRLLRSVRIAAIASKRAIDPYAKLITSLSAFGSIIVLALPKISIISSVNLDPSDPFATSFAIKNEGQLPLLRTNFGCRPSTSGTVNIINVKIQDMGRPVNLWPGQTITRSCSVIAPNVSQIVEVDAFMNYKTIYMYSGRREVHFSGRKGRFGYFLVPDAK